MPLFNPSSGGLATNLANLQVFGDGRDGDIAGGAGTTTLTRDTYYRNITLTAGDKLILKNFKLFWSGTLDITAADAKSIIGIATVDGGDAAGLTAGAAPTSSVVGGTYGLGNTGAAGKTGGTTTGVNGSVGATLALGNGGVGGASGAGGTGIGGSVAGGTSAASAVITAISPVYRIDTAFTRGTGLGGGTGGSTGGSGGGSVTGAAGGSGGCGTGGQVMVMFGANINRGASTPASTIYVGGGKGGAGGNSPTATSGGGGGSSGGGGGNIQLTFGALLGSTAANCIDASGGNGGNGGTGNTTGNGGNGGHGGNGGRIVKINGTTGAITLLDNTAVADTGTTAAVGTVAGTGGTGASTLMDL